MPAPKELIRRVPLFQGLDDKHIATLSRTFSDRTFPAGKVITSEGGAGVGFFVIEEGEATVTVGGEERRTLRSGDYFGEVALIDDGARSATITAKTDVKAHGLTSWQFRPLVEENASIAWPLLKSLARRLRELDTRETES
jgi:CRP/FNR family transcriptional regulator, cyclic AMP receptor protein